MQWQYQGKFLTGSGFLKAPSWRWYVKGCSPSRLELVGVLLSLGGAVIKHFSCKDVRVIPPPFPYCTGLPWAPLGLRQVLRRFGQDGPSAHGCLGHGKENRRVLDFLNEKCHCVLYRARRCMREDPKIEMLCVIPVSIPVPRKSSEIEDTFQEQEKNTWLCELALQHWNCFAVLPVSSKATKPAYYNSE